MPEPPMPEPSAATTRDPVSALRSGKWSAADQAALEERNRAAIALLQEWRDAPPDPDEERWEEAEAGTASGTRIPGAEEAVQ